MTPMLRTRTQGMHHTWGLPYRLFLALVAMDTQKVTSHAHGAGEALVITRGKREGKRAGVTAINHSTGFDLSLPAFVFARVNDANRIQCELAINASLLFVALGRRWNFGLN
jgi:hypothetical protein